MKLTGFLLLAAVTAVSISWLSPTDASNKVYRWVDSQGLVHYGDAIPPEYSRERHEVLDARGTRSTVHGEPQKQAAPVHDNRDRALLATYASVTEIEALRDRRSGYLEAQNRVAKDRLWDLQARQQELEGNPASINEIATVEQRIAEYQDEIARRNAEIAHIRGQFEADIGRFRELRGVE